MTEIFEATVKSVSREGRGVVEHKGRNYFVEGVWQGERIKLMQLPALGRYGQARLIDILEPSPERRQPVCPYHGFDKQQCGGCPWMFVHYQAQLKAKQNSVEHALKRWSFHRFGAITVEPIIPSSEWAYRNRGQFKTNGEKLGFVARGTKSIVDIDHCAVMNDKCNVLLKSLRKKIPNSDWRPAPGLSWNYIDIDDCMNEDDLKINQRVAFRQGNTEQNIKMQQWLRSQLEELPLGKALELFAGSGNFTEVFSQLGWQVHATESNEQAVTSLIKRRLRCVQADLMDAFSEGQWKQKKIHWMDSELLFMDPPREGFRKIKKFLNLLPRLNAIIYISCDVESWCHDSAKLFEKGWRLKTLQPIDLFPHTPHVELMSVFVRRG